MSYEEGNLEADFAADCEYSHCDWDDPGSDFLYGVLSERRFSKNEGRLYSFLREYKGYINLIIFLISDD